MLVAFKPQDMNPPDLGRAAEIFERLGKSCMEKKLLQMNAKGYWLQAGLCHLGKRKMFCSTSLGNIIE